MEEKEKQIRLDKYICKAAGLTRSDARKQIKAGRVTVDGCPEKKPDRKVSPHDRVSLDGETLGYQEYVYLMLHKPRGVVSATEDDRDRTVLDLIDRPAPDLFPVGRLDKDTEGLLLITNDGALAHRLLSPRRHVDKTYFARLDGPVGDKEIQAFRQGLDIGEKNRTMPAKLEPLQENDVRITIREGKFHQVKRMAHKVGRQVLYLKRLSMGPLVLDETLKPGEYRELTGEEIANLLEAAGTKTNGERTKPE